MDFFRSVFTEEDPDDPPPPGSNPESPPHSTSPPQETTFSSGWGFGGLVKSLATRSESVIETYRRDLQEFGSGLRNETLTLKQVASKAVKDLPSSVEISASKAHGAFTSIADIVALGKDALLSSDLDSDSPDLVGGGTGGSNLGAQSGRYSRFEAQLRGVQGDLNTYVVEPEDAEDYGRWKLGFDLGEKGEEIGDLMNGGVVAGIYKRVVGSGEVGHDEFWCRYWYRVWRLQQAESVRANLVKRAISKEDDEEELSWDVDDDDDDDDEEDVEEETAEVISKNVSGVPDEGDSSVNEEVGSGVSGLRLEEAGLEAADGVMGSEDADQKGESSSIVVDEKAVDVAEPIKAEELSVRDNEGRAEASDSGKESDVSVVSNQPAAPEEEDLGWDEIEDLGSDDEDKKADRSGVSDSSRAELRKRLSVAGDEEDLNWDIEDDED